MHSAISSGHTSPERPRSTTNSEQHFEQHGGRSMGPQALLELVEKIFKRFNPAQVTLDTHVDKSIAGMQVTNPHDDTFLRQVVYGIIRYRQFLGSIMDSFYHYNGGTALREDMDMYKIFGYLTVFRADELGYSNLKRLVDAKEPQKMVVFFKYLFDERYLRGALRDNWLKLYDKQFVDDIIGRLLAFKPEVAQLLDSLEERVYFTKRKGDESTSGPMSESSKAPTSTSGRPATTVPRPFNLSQPRPKPLPIEEPLPLPPKRRPAPTHTEGPTKEELAIQAAKEANRKRQEAKYANASPFKLHTTERPTNIEKIRAEIEADISRQLTFQPTKANPMPPPPNTQVKLNAAAILREDALYRKKQLEEAATLQRYEAELRDGRAFKQWQTEQLNRDEAARQAEVEARRAAMSAVHELAQRARASAHEENKDVVRQLKEEMRAMVEAMEKEREEEMQAKQAKRLAVLDARAGVAQAAERVAAEKRSQAEEERIKQAANAKALMEAQLRDIAEKRDIIMQLRAIEKVPRQNATEFDPTETPDHGLLEAMPLVELRERLVVVKQRAREEEERRRAQNLASKQEREQLLLDKAANIQRIRRVAAAQAQLRRTSTKEEEAAKEQAMSTRHDDGVLVLHGKLERKHEVQAAEKARLAAETKKIRFEQMQQAAGASQVEEHKFRELREGARREASSRQGATLAEATRWEDTRAKAAAVRSNVAKQAAREKADFLKSYEDRLANITQQSNQEQMEHSRRVQQRTNRIREREASLRQEHSKKAYEPFTGSKTTLQARLAALAQNLDKTADRRTTSAEG
uniref:Cilia- and flagella-associated protein 99 n=1 Tax=Dunaliella tertiolecta TaxID=3047 RepID=A0A7S3QMQ0_DUNTE|mmetsp:Transcript_17/g.33  ORF Transcript_17/g.33 Transcript_17/m.33 type:complete len:805 (-) Transcript_17:220-2634(-)